MAAVGAYWFRQGRKKDGEPITVRVIEYTVTTTDSDGATTSHQHSTAELVAGIAKQVGGLLWKPADDA